MKEVADMGPDNTSKVFSHVEGKQQPDPSTISIDDSVKKAIPENSLNTNLASNTELTDFYKIRDLSSEIQSKEEDVVLMQDVKPDISRGIQRIWKNKIN